MKHKEKQTLKIIGILIVTIVLIAGFVFLADTSDSGVRETEEPENVVVYFGQTEVVLEVADTPEKRAQGLSGRESLREGTGMLFTFDESDRHGIWMKDMQFAIDVLWLDEDFYIVYMVEHMSPESFPIVYRSRKPARYVVELPDGFISTHGIDVNTQMTPTERSTTSE